MISLNLKLYKNRAFLTDETGEKNSLSLVI
jgi:hypothetical protein